MRVLGTAGHVDHGKSTLVEALTGIHPDRLKEEREREMTIDLGFAWLTLPDGQEVGIVDVPGHRDFIENMLAGVGGIDAAIFVVAADEGVMPQTREHLAILDLLEVQGGVIALTKIDLIDEPDWLDLIESDLRQALAGSILEGAPVVRVSARSGMGLDELKAALSACLAGRMPRPDLGRPRLPVDRVFTVPGFGSVVTGTLSGGCFNLGEEVEILPEGLRGRVRGLQTHRRKAETAVPGSRTAINISGVAVEQLRRGQVVTHPGAYQTTRRLDVRFRLLADAGQPLRHNTQVKLFLGAAESMARVRLLGAEELLPGQAGWLQIEPEQAMVAARGDHYIIRRPSPGATLGGGVVVEPHPAARHRRFSKAALARLEALAQGAPSDVMLQVMLARGLATTTDLLHSSHLDEATAQAALLELLASGQAVDLQAAEPGQPLVGNHILCAAATWNALKHQALEALASYHRSYPLRAGMPREQLRSRMKDALQDQARLFSALLHRLTASGEVVENGPVLRLAGHAIRLSSQQEKQVERLLARFAAAPFSPPSLKECQVEVGEELVTAMIDMDLLVSVSPEVVFRTQDYAHMLAEVRRLLAAQPTLSAAEVRDHFNTSRKYALALLEYLDAEGVTVRQGDVRRLRNQPGSTARP